MSDTKLDEETERLIRDVAVEWDGRRKPPFVPASISIPALRQRIRDLIEEAKNPPMISTRQVMRALGATEDEMAAAELSTWESERD